MIVGVTGTGTPFTRLVAVLSAYASLPDAESVWIQHGAAALHPSPPRVDGAPLLPRPQLLARMRAASAVVCHGGCGTLADAFSVGHVPIVMARRAHLGEHVNDHQLELLDALRAERRILVATDADSLAAQIDEARRRRGPPVRPPTVEGLLTALRDELDRPAAVSSRASIVADVLGRLTRVVPLRRL